MSFHRVVLSVVAVLSLGFLIACGSSHSVTPPPTGSFSNSNLSGTYVFTIVGNDSAGAGDFESVTGTIAANGSGGITGGAIDFNDFASGELPNQPVTGGTYNVTADGRGQAIVTTTPPWGGTTLTLDFVLASSSGGSVTQFDANGTGSGTLTLQSAASQPAASNYVLALTGINGSGGAPGAIAGAAAVDSSGNITGSVDYNQNSNPLGCTITSGTISVSGTPGTAQLVLASPCGLTLSFDVYPVSANDYKLIETDEFPNFSGDLFLQTSTTFPSNQVVFAIAGLDLPNNDATPATFAAAGLMTSDGSSTLSNGEEDYNDAGVSNIVLGSSGTSAPQTFGGTITPPPSGSSRYTINVSNNFENGVNGTFGSYTFAAYPVTSSQVVLIEIDGNNVTAGMAYSQSNTSLASSQGYGMNLSANNSGGFEQDDIAEFTANNGSFSNGTIDMNDVMVGTLFDQSYSGTYQMDSPATGRGEFSSTTPDSNEPNIDLVFYTVNSTQTVFVEVDPTQLGLGTFLQQSASGSSSDFAMRHMATIRAAAKAMKARKAKENK